MRWTVRTHLMPPTVSRSASYDAVVERIARAVDAQWGAEPLEAALADIRRQQPEAGTTFGWTTYHPPGYRVTLRVSAADAEEARALAPNLLAVPEGWRVHPDIEVRATPEAQAGPLPE
jgi:hypothetical protein